MCTDFGGRWHMTRHWWCWAIVSEGLAQSPYSVISWLDFRTHTLPHHRSSVLSILLPCPTNKFEHFHIPVIGHCYPKSFLVLGHVWWTWWDQNGYHPLRIVVHIIFNMNALLNKSIFSLSENSCGESTNVLIVYNYLFIREFKSSFIHQFFRHSTVIMKTALHKSLWLA